MKLADALKVLDQLAPLRYAEGWDNVGLLVGDPNANVTRVLVTVDYSAAVADEAKDRRIDLVVAYHPPMFTSVKRVPHDALWAEAVRSNIGLYSMHTALDVAEGGTNDFLARACGVESMRPLRPFAKPVPGDPDGIGLGRIGEVTPTPLREIVKRLKTALEVEHLLIAGSLDAVVKRVAVAAGAGGELLADAMREEADLFVTGELRHHDAFGVLLQRRNAIATLHSNSERASIRQFAKRLGAELEGATVFFSDRDADPFFFG